MATISKSVRAGISAMLTAGALDLPNAGSGTTTDAGAGQKGLLSPDILMARSGYIVVAG